ncbi:hypothetical protein SDC9_57208 [bioreactor metagenome]|uniref:Uncharacterized protein n=1 Tax=bioreactor metagenome TaxID=1076179 RepID=A0A644X4T9_9ZZZZ|nr:hypothetical protein [Oscillibacter sp.]
MAREIMRDTASLYEAEEGCLSLEGTRTAKRWKSVKVRYQNRDFQNRDLHRLHVGKLRYQCPEYKGIV